MAPCRVVHSPGFDKDLENIGPFDERRELCLRAIKEAISRNPLVGREVGSRGVRMLMAHPVRAMPFKVFYYFDDGPVATLVGAIEFRM